MEPIFQAAKLSLVVGFWSTLVTVPVALLVATLLYRSKWRPVESLLLLPLFLPPTVTGFVLLWFLSPLNPIGAFIQAHFGRIVFAPVGTILACVIVSFPLAFQACIVGLARVQRALPESGLVLGGTKVFNTFCIVWPQMKGSIIVAALLVFARAVGEFGASMMVGGNIVNRTQTLPLAIYSQAEAGEYSLAAFACFLSVLLALGVYVFLRVLETRIEQD